MPPKTDGFTLACALAAGILAFARALPEHDLLFLRRDITQPDQVDAWLRDTTAGNATTVLAVDGPQEGAFLQAQAMNDIAALAVHLMTNTAITGATLDIDGGQQLVER